MTDTAQAMKNHSAYIMGYDAMIDTIFEMEWTAARDQFNEANPNGQSFLTLEGYHHAKGGLQALVDTMRAG